MNDLTRRRALTTLGAAGAAAVLAACSKAADTLAGSPSSTVTSTTTRGSTGSTSGGSAGTATGASCTVTPELTEGPYYLDLDLVRKDIREGRPGTPLKLTLTAVDADGCTPLANAAVDVWHCDAGGSYSGVNNAGGGPGGGGPGGGGRGRPGSGSTSGTTGSAGTSGTYLRGTQITDDKGVAEFVTVYPGWYQGRAVHIHFKVHPSSTSEMTGQLFFPDDTNAKVFGAGAYTSHGQPDQQNADDSIYQQSRGATLVHPTVDGDGYAAALTIGVASSGGSSQGDAGRRA